MTDQQEIALSRIAGEFDYDDLQLFFTFLEKAYAEFPVLFDDFIQIVKDDAVSAALEQVEAWDNEAAEQLMQVAEDLRVAQGGESQSELFLKNQRR